MVKSIRLQKSSDMLKQDPDYSLNVSKVLRSVFLEQVPHTDTHLELMIAMAPKCYYHYLA